MRTNIVLDDSLVYYEVLQGVLSEKEFGGLKEYLDSLTFYDLKEGRESYAAAARLYFKCREIVQASNGFCPYHQSGEKV